jgi:hypothetical protein
MNVFDLYNKKKYQETLQEAKKLIVKEKSSPLVRSFELIISGLFNGWASIKQAE